VRRVLQRPEREARAVAPAAFVACPAGAPVRAPGQARTGGMSHFALERPIPAQGFRFIHSFTELRVIL